MGKWIFCTDAQWAADITQAQYPDGNYEEDEYALWEADADGDATDENSIVHFYGTVDWGDVDVDFGTNTGWTDKDSTHYLEFTRSYDGVKHDGTIDGVGDTWIVGSTSGDTGLIRLQNVKIHDLRRIGDGSQSNPTIRYLGAGGLFEFYNNIQKNDHGGNGNVSFEPSASASCEIYNNFIITIAGGNYAQIRYDDAQADTSNLVINNTIYCVDGRGVQGALNNAANKVQNNLNFAQDVLVQV